jgi:hypothetical protein
LGSGGSGFAGWITTLIKAITDRLPGSLGSKSGATSLSVVSASDGFAITDIGVGLPNDTTALSYSGAFSLISLLKRFLVSLTATRINTRIPFFTSGDNTIVNAPVAGQRIVITALRVQNNTDIATTVLIKDGVSTVISGVRTTVDGTGFDSDYTFGNELRLTAATALVMNLSAANAHSTSVRYYLETVATGLPT